MRRFARGRGRRADVDNAIGSPAGVEMKDYADDADAHAQLDSLVHATQNTAADGARVVSPTPNAESSESSGHVSTGSNFNVQDTLDGASRNPPSTAPDTPSRLGKVIDQKYKTPQRDTRQQQQQQQVPMSEASSAGPTAQFNEIDFSPDFDNMENNPETMSEKSSDAGDFKEAFGDQIEALNDLLATPGKALGDLADTPISPDDDDSVDKEMEDLEGNSRLLSKELSQVGWYSTGGVKEETPSKQLFTNTPELKRQRSSNSDYDQLFSPSPAHDTLLTPKKSPPTPGGGALSTSNKKKQQDDSDSSFLPSVFGFSKTPVKEDRIGRDPNAKDDAVSEASVSAVSASSMATGSVFQSFAMFSTMMGDSLASPSKKSQSQESSTSHNTLVGEDLLKETPPKQLSTNLETVSPIRKERPSGMPPMSQSSGGRGQVVDDFDANTDTIQQPLINRKQEEHLLPRTPDRQKRDDDLKVQASYPGLSPARSSLVSPPAIYADETTTDEEDGFFVRVDKGQKADSSVVSQYIQDTRNTVVEEKPDETLTTRQIACLCGFIVVVAVCALVIALFATDMLADMENDDSGSAETPSGPLIIDTTPDPTSFPTRRPTPFPTPLETSTPWEKFDVDYKIRIADGDVNSIPSSAYAPDLIESMDRLSVGVLGAIQEGNDISSIYERRRLSAVVLPSIIVSVTEEECPNANGRDRCEQIIAGVWLSDDSNIFNTFRNALQQEVSSGGLQFFLLQVNPNSPISVLDPAQVPVITQAPNISVSLPPMAPSSGPNDPETALPTRSPALQPTPGTPNQAPSPVPTFPDGTTRAPISSPPFLQPVSPPVFVRPTPAPEPSPGLPPRPSPAPQPFPGLPTLSPVSQPSPGQTPNPAVTPSPEPPTSNVPQIPPTPNPISQSTPLPTNKPTLLRTARPTPPPTDRPTQFPTSRPSSPPIFKATPVPTLSPTKIPTLAPNPAVPTVYDLLVSKSFDGGAALGDLSSAQYKAYVWLLANKKFDKYDEEKLLQRYVMATLYFSTDGESWLNNKDWLTDEDECTWFSKAGQGACARGKLENLELDYNNLNGFLPEELGLLSNSLERIVLHGGPNEQLDGSIPTTIGYLTKLRLLFMPNNSIEGVLPSEIGNLTLLQQINLSKSRLQGSLPSTVGRLTSLAAFDVSGNQLTGELPGDIGMMEKLNKLLLQNNRFVGPIPSEIGQIRRLQRLEAYGNLLESIPSEIGNLAYCHTMKLEDNSIQGPIPTEIGELRRLRLLDLGNNRLTGNIPTEFGKLGELKFRLSIASNQIRGSIPTELGGLDKLRILDLRRNRLSGSIPNELSKMKKISTIHLDNNNLEGVIPDEVCSLYARTFPEFSTDCSEFDDNCPCCTTCCVRNQCTCRYEGTPKEYLCYSRTAEIEP